jgi:hypothetical protein
MLSISSAIIQNIITLREKELASLAYFYCDFREEDKQSRRNLLTSILFQLSAQSNLGRDILSRLYSTHANGALMPNGGVLTKCLKEMLTISA